MRDFFDMKVLTADPRWVQLNPSRIQIALTLLGAALAIGILVLVDWPHSVPVYGRWAIVGLAIMATSWEVTLVLLRGATSVRAFYWVELDADVAGSNDRKAAAPVPTPKTKLGIRLQCRNAAVQQGEVSDGAFVMPWFAAVPYRLPGDGRIRKLWPRILPLWRDSMNAEDFRAVRVRLRWT